MANTAASRTSTESAWPVMGTRVRIRIDVAAETSPAQAAEAFAVGWAALAAGEERFSVFRPDSELNRFARGEVATPSADLSAVIETAVAWQQRSHGAFSPTTAALTEVWRHAEESRRLPSADEIAPARDEARRPIGNAVRSGQHLPLSLNALAKGFVVDSATAAVMSVDGVEGCLIDGGGDISHRGLRPATIAVENPGGTADNAPAAGKIQIHNEAVASSGSNRRWFEIAGQKFSHVIDPRSGMPVAHRTATTVIADRAVDADAASTACMVDPPGDAVRNLSRWVNEGHIRAGWIIFDDGSVQGTAPFGTAGGSTGTIGQDTSFK